MEEVLQGTEKSLSILPGSVTNSEQTQETDNAGVDGRSASQHAAESRFCTLDKGQRVFGIRNTAAERQLFTQIRRHNGPHL
jgi:hypothetical protein